MPARLKKGDTVFVLSGKDEGKQGKVLRMVDDGKSVVVEGIQIAKRHQRPTQTFPGGIVEKPMPFSSSKVMVVCSHCKKPTRVRSGAFGEARLRVCVACGEAMDKEQG